MTKFKEHMIRNLNERTNGAPRKITSAVANAESAVNNAKDKVMKLMKEVNRDKKLSSFADSLADQLKEMRKITDDIIPEIDDALDDYDNL